MSMKWRDIPRDPIADDDELERLYQMSALQKPLTCSDSNSVAEDGVAQGNQLSRRKKAGSSPRDRRLGKVA